MLPILIAAAALAQSPCPQDKLVKVDLVSWKAALRKASPAEQTALLARLQLQPVPASPDSVPEAACGKKPVLEGVRVVAARLSPAAEAGGRKEKIVEARFELCPGDPEARFHALRVQVLRDEGNGAYCALSDELSLDQRGSDRACRGTTQTLPRKVLLQQLASATRDALEVRDASGTCDGNDQAATTTTTLFELQQDKLATLLEVKTYEANWTPPDGPGVETRRALSYSRDFPRRVTVTETIACGPRAEECKAGTQATVYGYRDGKLLKAQ